MPLPHKPHNYNYELIINAHLLNNSSTTSRNYLYTNIVETKPTNTDYAFNVSSNGIGTYSRFNMVVGTDRIIVLDRTGSACVSGGSGIFCFAYRRLGNNS